MVGRPTYFEITTKGKRLHFFSILLEEASWLLTMDAETKEFFFFRK
jgi:hypothetical protein